MTQREDVARDLTQDVFLKVYDNLDSFRHESEVYTWIHRIAVNHVLNHLKREKRLRPLDGANEIPGRVVQPRAGDPESPDGSVDAGNETAMERAERAKIVRSAVQSLPAKYRVPLVLFHYENLSYREIGEMMDLSLSAVESRIHRAKKRLLKILGPMIDQI
jgi:RNA polymerase sigma-70 factor (ECF subfamily)